MTDIRITLDAHNPAQKRVEGFFDTPPAHTDGKRVVVGDDPDGDFDGHTGEIAWSYDGVWHFDTPENGFIVWVDSESDYYRYKDGWEAYHPYEHEHRDYGLLFFQ